MTPLCEIAKRHGTDKYVPHGYTPIYDRLLSGRAAAVQKVLEVGIGKGKSLRMWEEFFPHARIIGIDIKPELLINAGRIESLLGDQSDKQQTRQIASELGGNFDLIVDDGSHDPLLQVSALETLLPFLADGGLYAIEDIRYWVDEVVEAIPAGYGWEAYEGGKRLPSGRGEVLMIIRKCST